MAYADSIRTTAPTMEAVASLIEGIPSSGYPLTFLTYSPTISAVAPFTFTSTTVLFAKYVRIGKLVLFAISFNGTAGGTLAGTLTVTLPIAAVNQNISAATQITDGGVIKSGSTTLGSSTSLIDIRLYNAAAYTAGAVGPTIYGFYEAA
jgi:hypothetical protein